MATLIMNNIVNENKLEEIQSKTLKEIANILSRSFGPYGSNACIKKENALSRYTKDGHTIISAIHYNGIIEQSIKDDIESITRHIVKTVGDGTTSAVILSSCIFDYMRDIKKTLATNPAELLNILNTVVEDVKARIMEKSNECSLEDVYDIAMISTNGNTFIAQTLKEIYEEHGMGVFIDVSPAMGVDTSIKSYNGMTLNTGYCDTCYITNMKNNTAEVDNPEVYFFEHPIDTKELGVYLDAIISGNIIAPASGQGGQIVPTVIFAPMISQDVTSTMDRLISAMANMPANNRLPICIITDYHDNEQLADLARMCGAKLIRKYIDRTIYEEDVKNNKAPTPATIRNWAGHCDSVIAYSDKTTFVRPHDMFNEDGSYSNIYNSLLAYLEAEVKNSIDNGDNAGVTGRLKRRLHSLKANMVELFIGGITQADRDALRDLVEDAVLNIRSAAANGVGLGANMTATRVLYEMVEDESLRPRTYMRVLKAIYDAYVELFKTLYGKTGDDFFKAAVLNAENNVVYNIRDGKWDRSVKSSIMSDVTILETVSKIVGLMVTCNQFVLPTAMHNIYVNND